MNPKNDQAVPLIPHSEIGLEDRSEELNELSEADIRIRFYQAMATIDEDRPGLVHRLCEAIATVMYDFCAIHLRTRQGDVDLVAAYDANTTLGGGIQEVLAVGQVIPSDVLEQAAQFGRTTFVQDGAHSMSFVNPQDPMRRVGVHSVIVCPLKTTRGELFGALSVGRHATSRSYDEADRALLEWIASHVSMKLETARLHRDLKRTNRKLFEKAEQLSEAVRVRDIFLATASHELKTPLSTLALQVEILRRGLDGNPGELALALSNNVEAIGRQVDRLNRLVSQLLDVSLLSEGRLDLEREEVDLYAIVLEVVSRFQLEASRRSLDITVEGAPVRGLWDPSRVDQIVANLLSNAIKYSERGEVTLRVSTDGDRAVLTVRDEGVGIAPDALARIFGRFERGDGSSKADGLGLGLWIVSQIVERLDGSISVQSTPGVGTKFDVRLPIGPVSESNESEG